MSKWSDLKENKLNTFKNNISKLKKKEKKCVTVCVNQLRSEDCCVLTSETGQ